MKLPKVSIVIAAYNEEKDLPNLMQSLKECNYLKNKLEVIVVDDGSTDKTGEQVKKFGFSVIKGPHKGVGNARNLGWKHSTGDILAFLDADMVISKQYPMEIAKYFGRHKDIAAVEDKEFLYNKGSLLARMHQLRHELGWAQLKVYIPRVFRKKVFDQLKGFDQDYGYYIDWELYKRMLAKGLKIGHVERAVVYHKQVEGLKELFSQCKWNGTSMVFALKDYKKDAFIRMGFVLLNALVPIYLLLVLSPFPFNYLGSFGLFSFLFIELKRSIKMFLVTKRWESFLTPIFDVVSMMFVLYGIIDKFISRVKMPMK